MAEMEKVVLSKGDVVTVSAEELSGESQKPDQGDDMSAKKLTKAELIEREKQVGRHCRGQLKAGMRDKINALMEAGEHESAQDLNTLGRTPCGYDMNEIFLKGPLDGQMHEYKCPKCGVEGTYRAAGPVADGE